MTQTGREIVEPDRPALEIQHPSGCACYRHKPGFRRIALDRDRFAIDGARPVLLNVPSHVSRVTCLTCPANGTESRFRA